MRIIKREIVLVGSAPTLVPVRDEEGEDIASTGDCAYALFHALQKRDVGEIRVSREIFLRGLEFAAVHALETTAMLPSA